ncbi:MAG: lipopolysaccharide biosynthesis protein [Phycisphaerae bacterium]
MDPARPDEFRTDTLNASHPMTPHDGPRGLFRSTPLARSLGTYLPAIALVRLINFGRLWLLTWFMALPELGLLTLILGMVNVLIPLCSLGLNDAVTRFVPLHEQQGTLSAFMRRSILFLLAITFIGVLLILILSPTLGDLFYARAVDNASERFALGANAPRLAQASAIVAGLSIVYFYLLSVLKGLRMFYALSRMEVSHAFLFLIGSGIAIVFGRPTAFVLIVLYGLALALPIAYFGPRLFLVVGRWKRQRGTLTEQGWESRMLRFSIWTTLSGVTWQALVVYSAWYLTKVFGHEAVGVFNTTHRIAQFILVSSIAVTTVVMTTVTKTWEAEGRERAERQLSLAFRGTCFALFIACTVLALCRGLIMGLFRSDYVPGAAILPLQLLFFLIAAQLSFLPAHFQLREKTRQMFWPWAVAVAVNAVFAYGLVGPHLHAIQASAVWRGAGPILSVVFTTGFSSEHGLDAAAWCGVFGIAAAMLLFLVLIYVERGGLDQGSYIVIGASILLAARPAILAVGAAVLLLLAVQTNRIFDTLERRRMIDTFRDSIRHVPGLKQFLLRRSDQE